MKVEPAEPSTEAIARALNALLEDNTMSFEMATSGGINSRLETSITIKAIGFPRQMLDFYVLLATRNV